MNSLILVPILILILILMPLPVLVLHLAPMKILILILRPALPEVRSRFKVTDGSATAQESQVEARVS